MSDTIKAIAFTICGTPLHGEPCEDCPHDDGNCTHILTAKCVYTAHVKPLEDALAKAEADKTALVEALGGCKNLLECMRDDSAINEFFQREAAFEIGQAIAALARAKGEE